MEAADLVDDAGLAQAVLVPRPRTVTARCGVALRMPASVARRVVELLLASGKIGAVYRGSHNSGWRPCPADEIMGPAEEGDSA
jgi:hypothetical protein